VGNNLKEIFIPKDWQKILRACQVCFIRRKGLIDIGKSKISLGKIGKKIFSSSKTPRYSPLALLIWISFKHLLSQFLRGTYLFSLLPAFQVIINIPVITLLADSHTISPEYNIPQNLIFVYFFSFFPLTFLSFIFYLTKVYHNLFRSVLSLLLYHKISFSSIFSSSANPLNLPFLI
jgi:hypothetical protein